MKKLHLLLIPILLLIFSCKEDEPVIADFEYKELSNGEVQFTNKSTGADTYTWDFGGGKTSLEKDPKFTFDENKDYSVSLAAKGKSGQNQISKTLKITSNPDFSASFANTYAGKYWSAGGYSTNKANVVINLVTGSANLPSLIIKKIDRTTLSISKITGDWAFTNVKATSPTTFVINETVLQTDGSKAVCKGTGKLDGKNLEIAFDSDNGYVYATFLIRVAVQ